MKSLHRYILFVLFGIISCKKDTSKGNQPIVNSKLKHKIEFDLSGFTQQIIGNNKVKINSVESDLGSLKSAFDSVGYVVFDDSVGVVVNQKTFATSALTSNIISDSLTVGKYTIAVYAGQSGITVFSGLLTYGFIVGSNNTVSFNPWKDTFAKTIKLTVNGDIQQNITLERIVSKVEVDINDTLPVSADSFDMTFNTEYFTYDLFTASAYKTYNYATTVVKQAIPDSAKAKPNFKLGHLTLATGAAFPFTVRCLGIGGSADIIALRDFNPTIQKNYNIVYSGNFFGTPGSSDPGFQATINPGWDPTPINIGY